MTIQNIGLPQTNEAWRTNPGTHQTDMHNRLLEAKSSRKRFDATAADLTSIGFTGLEVAYMKNAIYLADILARIWLGELSFVNAITEINALDASGLGTNNTTASLINIAESDPARMRGPIGM